MSRGILHRDLPDTTDPVGPKFRRGVHWVERAYDDRWPARGQANVPGGEYEPLDLVSRDSRRVVYKRRPQER